MPNRNSRHDTFPSATWIDEDSRKFPQHKVWFVGLRKMIRHDPSPTHGINPAVTPILSITSRIAWYCSLPLLVLAMSQCAVGEDFHAGFDEGQTSWKVNYEKSQLRMLSHRRHQTIFRRGRACENFEFDAPRSGGRVQLEHTLPHARVFNELKLSLWVRSNRRGAALFVRVVFPHQIDPRTKKVLHTFLWGETYSNTGHWQLLTCTTPQKQMDVQIRQIRARLKNTRIDPREAYVDRAYLTTRLSKGTTEFFLDELKLGPIVEAKTKADVLQVAEEGDEDRSPVEFRLNQLRVEGAPFFPRMMPDHGELPKTLGLSRANVVWMPNADNLSRIDSLRREDMWTIATPPRPSAAARDSRETKRNRIRPFGTQTRSILWWNLGLQIPPEAKDALVKWKRQIEDADVNYRRPLMADVTGLEHVYSRHIGMLGVSRFPIGSSLSPLEYRNWLIQRRKTARPGSFIFSWIQTEMNASAVGKTSSRSTFIEPEQIRLQLYAALAAGCRGIGYWKTGPLNSSDPAALERQLALTQLNLELELLEPWLATGTVVEHVPFLVTQPGLKIGRRSIDFLKSKRRRKELLNARDHELRVNDGSSNELEATLIRTDYGMLLLPVWYHKTAFYVPSQMAANDVTIVVRGVGRAAPAWQVSTTGIRSLESERINGGVKITIPRFDQTAAVILTADRTLIAKIRHKIDGMAELSARTSIDLVQAKLDRVRRVDTELELLGVGQRDAPQLLVRATRLLANAENAFGRRDFHGARQTSGEAAQSLRILQSAHWYDAIRSLSSPVASPYTASFQTLPDHWRLMAYLGRTRFKNDANILASGDFEDIDTMIADGWSHTQNNIKGVTAAAELSPMPNGGGYALRLVAVPKIGTEPPRVVDHHPVTVTTPAMRVSAGQIIHVSGRVRIVGPITGNVDGVMLYDSQSGPRRALRWKKSAGWQQFELLRKVEADGELRLTIALTGLGEAQFDNIRVVPHSPRLQVTGATSRPTEKDKDGRWQGWDFIPKIPKWSNPLPGIQKSLPGLRNRIPKLDDALPKWNSVAPQTPVPSD